VRSKGCLSNKTALAMIFKLAEAAEKSWHRLNGHNQLPKIILGVRFTDGIEVVNPKAQAAAARPLPSPRFSDSSCCRKIRFFAYRYGLSIEMHRQLLLKQS
jgi:hypothetical protein